MAEDREKMREEDLLAICKVELSDCIGYESDDITAAQKQTMDRYCGRPMGNEQQGRSQIVMTDVRDAVEWVLPGILRVFLSTDNICKFEPVGPEDEDRAKQDTDYVSYIVTKRHNGFLLFYEAMKDALLSKVGIWKRYWDPAETVKIEETDGLDMEAFDMLIQDPDVEVLEYSSEPDHETGLPTISAKIKRTEKGGRVRIECVPPEEVLVSKRAKSVRIEDAPFVCHRRRATLSDIRKMGFQVSKDDIRSSDGTTTTILGTARLPGGVAIDEGTRETLDESLTVVDLFECYPTVDWDGDGIARLRRVLYVGNDKVLANDLAEEIPFSALPCIINTHQFHGLSLADLVVEIQDLETTLVRQILDNVYQGNMGRWGVVEGEVNLDDLLTPRLPHVIRMKQPGSLQDLSTQPIPPVMFSLLDYIKDRKEATQGFSSYGQGMDSNTLNKTATGITAIMAQALERRELIARTFAETGVKDLFLAVARLTARHQRKNDVVKLRGEWVEVDPGGIIERDVTVTVGLGVGTKDQTLGHLSNILETQLKLAAAQPFAHLVTDRNIYETTSRMVENAGFKESDAFFTDPATVPPPMPMMQPGMDQGGMPGMPGGGMPGGEMSMPGQQQQPVGGIQL